MSDTDKIIMFPENNGFGNGNFGLNGWGGGLIGFILGILFGNGGFFGNGWGGNNGMFGGAGFLSNQLNNDAGREMIMNAINGTDSDVRLLATTLNANVNQVQAALNTINTSILKVGADNGMSALQTINAIQAGNASLASQMAQCCCENRLLTTQQGYESQIRTLEQTNQLGSQADRNNNAVLNAIQAQSTMITKEFCDARERDMQDKINNLTAENATLKTTINNNAQTAQIGMMINGLQNELNAIKAAQPQTITLPLNNYQAVPSLVAGFGTDFWASYLANRITGSSSTTNGTTTTTVNG